MHMDLDSGFLVPDDPIPDFGASLENLAFDDRTLSTVLQPSGETSKDPCPPMPLQATVSQYSEYRFDAAPHEIVNEVLAKYAKCPFKG